MRLLFVILLICLVYGRDYWNVIPVYYGSVSSNGQNITFAAKCFQQNVARITQFDQTGLEIEIYASNPLTRVCSDLYLVATLESLHYRPVVLRGRHKVRFTFQSQDEYNDVLANGVPIFQIKDGIFGTLADMWKLYGLFKGSHQVRNNIEFLHQYMNITFKSRTASSVDLPESYIQSGDHFAILNLEHGMPLILYGTGGTTDHVAMALEMDGQMYVVESAGTNFTHGKEGIIATPYKQWYQDVLRCNQIVVWLPLSQKAKSMFNQTAAVNYFKSVEGMPYGFHNFIFTWIDTPNDNFPHQITDQFFAIFLSVLDRVNPALVRKTVLLALNQRLKADYTSMAQVFAELEVKNMTFGDLISIPELDDWKYEDGYSMVCSSFVARMYKAAGVIPVNFQATEVTPRDLYQLNLFDTTTPRPSVCNVDSLPYCQISGTLELPLPEYSTIEPYDNMFEKCGAMPPGYERFPDHC